jgi:hypothetical protein
MTFWAKAPELAGAELSGLREQTERDRSEYLYAGLRSLRCDRCAAQVLVKKNSHSHTSIQWLDSSDTCPEFAEHAAQGENTALLESCPFLRDSIDHAVRSGVIEVRDPG